MFWPLLKKEILLKQKQVGQSLSSLWFFIATSAIFSLGVGGDQEFLKNYSVEILLTLFLFSHLQSSSFLFSKDQQSGVLEQMLLKVPVELYVFAKVCAQWLFVSLPFLICLPLISFFLEGSFSFSYEILFTFGIMSLILNFLSALGSALVLGSSFGVLSFFVILMPFMAPCLLLAQLVLFGKSEILRILLGITIITFPITLLGCSALLKRFN